MKKEQTELKVTRRRLTPADRIAELQDSRAKHLAAVEKLDAQITAIRIAAKQQAADLLAQVEEQ